MGSRSSFHSDSAQLLLSLTRSITPRVHADGSCQSRCSPMKSCTDLNWDTFSGKGSCYSSQVGQGSSFGAYYARATWATARSYCASIGARLCSAEELAAVPGDVSSDQWTNDACEQGHGVGGQSSCRADETAHVYGRYVFRRSADSCLLLSRMYEPRTQLDAARKCVWTTLPSGTTRLFQTNATPSRGRATMRIPGGPSGFRVAQSSPFACGCRG